MLSWARKGGKGYNGGFAFVPFLLSTHRYVHY
jgi:hypothetical protein